MFQLLCFLLKKKTLNFSQVFAMQTTFVECVYGTEYSVYIEHSHVNAARTKWKDLDKVEKVCCATN